MIKWDKKLGTSKREQGIETRKAPQNRGERCSIIKQNIGATFKFINYLLNKKLKRDYEYKYGKGN